MFARIIGPIQALLLSLTVNYMGYFLFYVTPSAY